MKFYLHRFLAILALFLTSHPFIDISFAYGEDESTQASPTSRTTVIFPDFDNGLMRNGKGKKTYYDKLGPRASKPNSTPLKERLNMLRSNYDRIVSIIKQNSTSKDEGTVRIPRIIHQIWLGSNVPSKYQQWMSTWMNWLGWEYMLWTDKDVAQLQLVNQHTYDAAKNYGAKSDILRLELLYMMGGIYVDTDFECLNPDFFEILHKNVDFYIGIEPLEHTALRINNAVIGSAPGHPLLQKMIDQLPANFEANKYKWPLVSTGPVFITRIIYDYMNQKRDTLDLFLPCSLVYPFNAAEVDRCSSPDQLIPMKETAAIHYWSKSWFTPKKAFKDKNIP